MKNWRDKFDRVGSFSNERPWVKKNGNYFHADEDGNITTPITFAEYFIAILQSLIRRCLLFFRRQGK